MIFIDIYEHVYTYRSRKEFQNILERKLCNCYRQLKNVKQGIGHDTIVLMDTLDIPEIHRRFDECLAVQANDELESLLLGSVH